MSDTLQDTLVTIAQRYAYDELRRPSGIIVELNAGVRAAIVVADSRTLQAISAYVRTRQSIIETDAGLRDKPEEGDEPTPAGPIH